MKRTPDGALDVTLCWPDGEVQPVGRLAIEARQVIFEYAPAFVSTGLEISPLKLKAALGVQTGPPAFGGLPGVFHDSLPDAWGRLLIDRRAMSLGIRPASLSVIDRLACVGGRGMGALCYRPATDLEAPTAALDLDALAADAGRVLDGEAAHVLGALVAAGGSPGGARPKVVVAWRASDQHVQHGAETVPSDHEAMLVKFGAPGDPTDAGPIELAYARMAQAAGVPMMPSVLLPAARGPGYFATTRFDRPRLHVHTLAGLLHTDHTLPNLDYDHLLRVTGALTRDQRQVAAAFRLMVFNVLSHNRDDHGKQFSFLMDRAGVWRLAPAYDLTCADGPGGEHTMTVLGEGAAPDEPRMLTLAKQAGIANASEIIEEVRDAISRWPQIAKAVGVSASSRRWVSDRLKAAAR